jgi:hypothetical protein
MFDHRKSETTSGIEKTSCNMERSCNFFCHGKEFCFPSLDFHWIEGYQIEDRACGIGWMEAPSQHSFPHNNHRKAGLPRAISSADRQSRQQIWLTFAECRGRIQT